MFNIQIKNIDKVIGQIKQYKKDIAVKEKKILERLQSYGATSVSLRFARAVTDYPFDYSVETEMNGNTVIISVKGEQVAFIEFGAGVRYGYGYLGDKPEGIVPIGEYGNKKGRNPEGWFFRKDGELRHSYGVPPNMPMYYTVVDLCEYCLDVVREVFNE